MITTLTAFGAAPALSRFVHIRRSSRDCSESLTVCNDHDSNPDQYLPLRSHRLHHLAHLPIMSLLVLSAADVAKVTSTFSPDELVALMANVFSRLSERRRDIEQPHRVTLSMAHHTSLFMPSRITCAGTTMKVVSVPTSDAPKEIKEKGLPATTIVLDEQFGSVKAVVNARRLTALRNAAGMYSASRYRKLCDISTSPDQAPCFLRV